MDSLVKLADFMQLKSMVSSGGQAKVVIQGGQVLVNGNVETRRGKKLQNGDKVSFNGGDFCVGQ